MFINKLKGSFYETLKRGDTLDIVGSLHINTFSGNRTPQIIIQDFRRKQ